MHISALNNLNQLATFVLTMIKDKGYDQAAIKKFINSQTDEGFTALHFSAFRGNIVTIQ